MTETTNNLTDMLEAELKRLREDTEVGRRMTALEVLLAENGTMTTPGLRPAPEVVQRRSPGVSAIKLRAITQYMQEHGEARQVDVHRDLEENSGTVSLALRALAEQGVVEDTGEVEGKSKIWRYTGEPSGSIRASDRVTAIEPGVGVSEGRRK